jgi:hypothetical protein
MQAGLDRLQSEANAKDAVFNANLAKQRELSNQQSSANIAPQLTQRDLSQDKRTTKLPSNYLTQEQVQAQNEIDKKMVPIKEPEYTEAGKVGKGIREGIGSALGYAGDFANEYFNEPLLNLPGQIGNISNAAMEGVAGFAGYPVNLGRYERMNFPTRFDKKEPYPAELPEKPQPLSEKEPTPEAEPKPKEALKKAYAVVFAGEKASKNATFDNPEDAKKYYADQGGTKGGVITLSPQKSETAQEQAERIAYGQSNKKAEERNALKQKLTETGRQAWAEAKKAREAENAANRAKFGKFKEDVASNKEALNAYNRYNKNQGLLNRAYNAAIQNENYGAAIKIQNAIERNAANVPAEMSQRQEFFKQQTPVEKRLAIEGEATKRKSDLDLLAKLEANRIANEKYNQSRSASNPDAPSSTYSYNEEDLDTLAKPFNR